jgi:predicted AlkP superfamily pyrophosphatase or phosphodiesterase
MGKVLLISLDAIGDHLWPDLSKYPNIRSIAKAGTVVRNVSTVFLSNTYPAHASVVTGVHPVYHGIISNTEAFPSQDQRWMHHASSFQRPTLWQECARHGKTVAAVLWPVTGGAKEIQYHIPEMHPKKGENQIRMNMVYGSPILQIQMIAKFGMELLKGLEQPTLDRFAGASMAWILKNKQPDLALLHLTAYDTLCHTYGQSYAKAIHPAFSVMDKAVGAVLDAISPDTTVILMSDHAQIDLIATTSPNEILVELGLLNNHNGYVAIPGRHPCFFECCGGSAFFHDLGISRADAEKVRKAVSASPAFRRFLTEEEMHDSGHADLPWGYTAKVGYSLETRIKAEKGQHGYTLDLPDYQVFYVLKGPGIAKGALLSGGSLLELAPLILRILSSKKHHLSLPGLQPCREDLFSKDSLGS